MAYLTNYTFSKLSRKLEVKQEIDLELFLNKVYNDPKIFRLFNKFEIRYLFVYKQLLESLETFQKTYYLFVPEREDTKKLVFEKGGKLKYHLNKECRLINNNFIDFTIPIEITEKGDIIVQEYRDWFKSKGYAEDYFLKKLDLSKVVFDYNMIFPPRYGVSPLNENYKLIMDIANSNDIKVEENFDFDLFLSNIDHLEKKHENIFSCKTSRILSKFDYLLNKSDYEIKQKISELFCDEFIDNFGMNKLKNLLNEAKNIKYEIMVNLLNFFKWTYKLSEKDFEPFILEKFGLVCCEGCKKNEANSN